MRLDILNICHQYIEEISKVQEPIKMKKSINIIEKKEYLLNIEVVWSFGGWKVIGKRRFGIYEQSL